MQNILKKSFATVALSASLILPFAGTAQTPPSSGSSSSSGRSSSSSSILNCDEAKALRYSDITATGYFRAGQNPNEYDYFFKHWGTNPKFWIMQEVEYSHWASGGVGSHHTFQYSPVPGNGTSVPNYVYVKKTVVTFIGNFPPTPGDPPTALLRRDVEYLKLRSYGTNPDGDNRSFPEYTFICTGESTFIQPI